MAQDAISTRIVGFTVAAAASALFQWCRACARRRRQRHFLAQLDAHGLRDIGITRAQAGIEAERPFWR